ncbi:MAG TPA: hypothetical protein VLT33_45690, partial [Labilithrix sp.]|nr:hypothetical protein [Labilithrix sp.]
EALAIVPDLSDDVRARLVARAKALAGDPRDERELAPLAVALLASWPAVPEQVLSRLDHEVPGASPATPTHETNGSETEEITMTVELQIDVRGLPPALQSKDAQKAYVDSVKKNLTTAMGGTEPPAEAIAYSVGKLLRTGQFTGTSASFFTFVKTTWDQLTSQYKARTGMVSGMVVVQRIVKLLGGTTNGSSTSSSTSTNGSGGGKSWTAQQLAFIFEQTVETLQTIAPEDSGFATRVDRAYLDYASGDIGYDGFQLPELDATTDGDLLPQNMMAAGRLYGGFEFERLRLIPVIDRVAELWRAGVVPIGNDSGGQLLNEYFWAREQRLTEGARGLIFGRLFGVTGTETSKDSQPNKGFEALLRRFLTNVAQLRRLQDQQVVISNPGESKTLMSENVRKTGRELATNLSLYGWGSAYFDASRIDAHIALAYKIADDAQVQQAFAATTPWQVVERVSQQEFGVTPNIVKHHTMAMAGRRIIEILAQNPSALTSRLGEFQDLLGVELWNELSRLALGWLSVNGVTSEQLVSYAAPVDAIASPSVPTMPAQPGASPNMSRLRDMVSSGQMPSLDQLQRMFN